jgi:amino acid transporter
VNEPPLRRALGVLETAGISVAMMAPTAAMALNGALAAQYAGPAVPLSFVLAFAIVGCVAFAFITFARVYASPASVGEFNARGLGPLAGRLSGWTLLLAYFLFTAGSAAEFGAFASSAFALSGWVWLPLALACLAVCAYVGTRPMQTSSRAMLAIEGLSVAAIIVLSILIFAHGGAHGVSFAAFTVDPTASNLKGLGLATVFSLLSFAGFEGAAVLGAESLDPTRTIPRALIGSIVLAGALYVFVTFAQSVGFGLDAKGVAAFAASGSPLGDLARRYMNGTVSSFVMLGAAISAFAATLGSATAAARLLYAFARDGHFDRRLARVGGASGTPTTAYLLVLALGTIAVVGFASVHINGIDTFAACGTIATLALILIYGAVQIAALRLFRAQWTRWQRAIPVIALLALFATFIANVIPIPAGPAALYPAIVIAWIVLGLRVMRLPASGKSRARPSVPH